MSRCIHNLQYIDKKNLNQLLSVMFGSDRIRTYRGKDKRSSPVGSYRLPTPERVPEKVRSRIEERQDGRSRAGGSERSEEPQRDMRENQVILVLRL